MPLTEINVTNPPPVFRNYWTERDARRAATPPPPPWPAVDPGLLEEGRPKLPVFPLQVFPHQWREWVKDAAQWAGSSEDYIAQALLASVAGLCGQGVSARITEAWSEPVILWQALVGGPSSGKTPALEWLRRPLGTVERMLAREGGAPVVVSDASLPALEKAVAKRRQGVLLWRDEPTAWLAGLGRKSRRDESKRGPFPTPGARSACRGAAATSPPSASWARSIRSGWTRRWRAPATALPRASSMSGRALRPTARCAR
jgi:Protein of unknown function (DUF3987)